MTVHMYSRTVLSEQAVGWDGLAPVLSPPLQNASRTVAIFTWKVTPPGLEQAVSVIKLLLQSPT